MITRHSALTALGLLLCLSTAEACGPDFSPDVFLRTWSPDRAKQFVRGHLGLLQAGFYRADLFIAFRYLEGGTLDAAEVASLPASLGVLQDTTPDGTGNTLFTPETEDASPNDWVAARATYPNPPSATIDINGSIKTRLAGGYEYTTYYLNCTTNAFRTATATLQSRANQWGKTSPALLDWLHAQDTVFNDCSGEDTMPTPAPNGSPVLLQQDRAYQMAAARLYAGDYATAAAGFRSISQDRFSPWQPGAGYLAARALIRQAFFAKQSTGQTTEYDPTLMQAAEDQLRSFLSNHPPEEWRKAAEARLAFIAIRLHPEQRAAELSTLLSGPAHDPNYAQDLTDLLWIADKATPEGLRAEIEPGAFISAPGDSGQGHTATASEAENLANAKRMAAYEKTASLRSAAPITDWAITVQALAPSASAHALQQWRLTHTLPWLVAALMLAPNGATGIDDLVQAAATIPDSSPAWQTITYHRARLLLISGHAPEARDLLSSFSAKVQSIPAEQREPSTVNAIRGLQALVSTSTHDFLAFAPQTMLLRASEEGSSNDECLSVMLNDKNRHYDCVDKIGPEQLDGTVAQVFNTEAPLSVWLAAATSASLPQQLREAIAEEGWTRSKLLGDASSAAAFLPLLPAKLQEEAKQPTPLAPWVTIARNPGLRPYLNAGVQRAYSYDFVESYRDNWCYKVDGGSWASPIPASFAQSAPAFLDLETLQQGRHEAQQLAEIRSVYVGQQILRQVQANTADPHAAEALFLVLRMIRYGCVEPAQPPPPPGTSAPIYGLPPTQEAKDLLKLKQDASRLLRRYYAASPWTKKAAPFAG